MAGQAGTGRSVPQCLTLFCLLVSCIALAARTEARRPSRQDLDINLGDGGGISISIGGGGGGGGGGGSARRGGGGGWGVSSPSSSEPRACDFENERLYKAYLVIQSFRKAVTRDPMDIASSWTGTNLCDDKNTSYKGFYCDRPPNVKDRTVASVDFNGYMLQAGSLRDFVGSLPDLALFHANSNNFDGAVPNLTALPYLYELDLSNNKLAASTFPTDVLGLRNATFIDIRFNNFYGELPAELFYSFPRVQAIFVNNNRFSGNLPDNLGDSPVNYLSLANNNFTGQIPTSIASTANTLFEVLFLNNSLSGCLPYELGLLAKATVIDAGTNQLTGTIPASFACLQKVEQLNLADNLLHGEVPDALCRLANAWYGSLKNLTLSGNYFTSLGLCCWRLIKEGILNVDRNCIPWAPNQRSHEECASYFFHRTKKTCPISTYVYVPCRHKHHGTGETAAAGREEPPAAEDYKYRTYSALQP